MMIPRPGTQVSRRSALAAFAAGGLGAAVGTRRVAAQDAEAAMATHPIVGAWLVARNVERAGFETIVFTAEGLVVRGASITLDHGPRGVWLSSPGVGAWEPTSERDGAFTTVTMISDPAGEPLGSTTVDGVIEVSDDGLTFGENSFETRFTYRDKSGAITGTATIEGSDPLLSARRIRVNAPGFPGS